MSFDFWICQIYQYLHKKVHNWEIHKSKNHCPFGTMAATTHWDTSTENHCEAVISAFYYNRNWFSIFLCNNIKHEVYLHAYEWLHDVIFYSGLLYLQTSSKLMWSRFWFSNRATENNGNGLVQLCAYLQSISSVLKYMRFISINKRL